MKSLRDIVRCQLCQSQHLPSELPLAGTQKESRAGAGGLQVSRSRPGGAGSASADAPLVHTESRG